MFQLELSSYAATCLSFWARSGELLYWIMREISLSRDWCGFPLANLLIRNQDEIFQEKGKIIFTEYGPQAYKEVDKELARLYPEEKLHYLALDAITIGGKPYSMLLQVGFLRKDRLRIGDTLPMMDDVILPGEKNILSSVFENILEGMLSSPQYCYLN